MLTVHIFLSRTSKNKIKKKITLAQRCASASESCQVTVSKAPDRDFKELGSTTTNSINFLNTDIEKLHFVSQD